MKLLNKAIRTFSIIFILYAVFAFVIIIRFIPYSNLLLGMSILTIIAFLISIFYSYSITKPIEKLENHIEKISKGELSELKYPLNKPYSKIFSNLNEISNKLQQYDTKLSKRKEGFNIIIESIKEAIWIQDDKGLIRTYNTSFVNLVQMTDVKNQYFWNVIRTKELYEIVDGYFKNPVSKTKEIEFDSKHFLCSTSYSEFNKETVFILYDITEFRQLKTIKKDFVLNVSHELRTPLTSIKGYLETFEDDLDEKNKNYVEIIKRNTERLIHIVNDLLTLSRLEHDNPLEIETTRVDDFLNNISHIFAHRIEEKGLKLVIKQNNTESEIRADVFQLEQVFINLIDNAIKYTDKGEIRVIVEEAENYLKFIISDSGNGIAEEHLSRLFERFYVVDKSRSRRLGGTGLGLSIVKHIINLHGGTIDVESEIGKGTKFIISIPKT
jgi:two-component system, OmpR family, phosphate regulon sensor histidine kinase PhoR